MSHGEGLERLESRDATSKDSWLEFQRIFITFLARDGMHWQGLDRNILTERSQDFETLLARLLDNLVSLSLFALETWCGIGLFYWLCLCLDWNIVWGMQCASVQNAHLHAARMHQTSQIQRKWRGKKMNDYTTRITRVWFEVEMKWKNIMCPAKHSSWARRKLPLARHQGEDTAVERKDVCLGSLLPTAVELRIYIAIMARYLSTETLGYTQWNISEMCNADLKRWNILSRIDQHRNPSTSCTPSPCECVCLWSVRFPRPSRPVQRLLQSVRSWKGPRLARFSCFPAASPVHLFFMRALTSAWAAT